MIVFINNARLSFPALFRAEAMDGGEPKFGCDLIIGPDTKVLAVKEDGAKVAATMDKVMAAVAKEAWGDRAQTMMESFERRQKCYRDGNFRLNGKSGEPHDGYEGAHYVVAKNKRRPTLIDGQRNALTEQDGKLYSGCYVTAKIDVYPNKKAGTMGVFAELLGVQFVRDGEAFGGSGVASPDDFDLIEGADEGNDDLL